MNFPRIAMAAVAAWIASLAVGFLVNDFLLADVLRANQAAMRPEAELTARLPVGSAAVRAQRCRLPFRAVCSWWASP